MAKVTLKKYHAKVWDEPFIMEMSTPGERGILVEESGAKVKAAVGTADAIVPEAMKRKNAPDLPEVAQPQVLRHYFRLSQQTMGCDVANDIGSGTCTMKYNPKVNEKMAALPKMTEIHPFQDEETIQGSLEVLYKVRNIVKEISGMDEATLHPGSGSQAIFTACSLVRAYHEANGEGKQRDQVITTMYSHPADAATPATLGYEVLTIMPGEDGYPDFEALKKAVSERTAAIFMTNPEDIGLYNPRVKDFVDLVHSVGGLCFTDQANANGILGVARSGDVGFDMCHYNLHKTFSAPHGSFGPAAGATVVTEKLARFLPKPVVTFDGEKYHLDYDRPDAIGNIRYFYGNVGVVLRAYTWAKAMGADGLRECAELAVINNNYLEKLLLAIKGIDISYGKGELGKGKIRLDQARYTLEPMTKDTGIGSELAESRITDFGVVNFWGSHHPWIIPEPFTPEPAESFSRYDIEYWAACMEQISKEAYSDPEIIKTAPHNSFVGPCDFSCFEDLSKNAVTYKQYMAKKKAGVL